MQSATQAYETPKPMIVINFLNKLLNAHRIWKSEDISPEKHLGKAITTFNGPFHTPEGFLFFNHLQRCTNYDTLEILYHTL